MNRSKFNVTNSQPSYIKNVEFLISVYEAFLE